MSAAGAAAAAAMMQAVRAMGVIVKMKPEDFFTVTKEELRLPPSAEVISADSMYVPG